MIIDPIRLDVGDQVFSRTIRHGDGRVLKIEGGKFFIQSSYGIEEVDSDELECDYYIEGEEE